MSSVCVGKNKILYYLLIEYKTGFLNLNKVYLFILIYELGTLTVSRISLYIDMGKATSM